MEVALKVAKWGNSLAIRIPKDVERTLGLVEGDEVELSRASATKLEIARVERREVALNSMRRARWKLPDDYKFDREEANAR